MDRAFSALDIARLLVRNPDEVMEWPTYDRICDQFCRGRALENLSRDEKDAIFSFEVGVNDLIYLGFSKEQVQTMVEAFQEAFDQVKNIHYAPDMVDRGIKERVYLTAYTAAAFPYGPPIILTEPYNVMAKQQFSLTQARTYMTALTKATTAKLMDRWMENRTLFIPQESPQMDEFEIGDSEFSHSP